MSRLLLLLMDGTRDHAALRDDLTAAMESRLPLTMPNEITISDRAGLTQMIAETLEENLQKCARLALLVG